MEGKWREIQHTSFQESSHASVNTTFVRIFVPVEGEEEVRKGYKLKEQKIEGVWRKSG